MDEYEPRDIETTLKKSRPEFKLNLEDIGVNNTDPRDFNHRISQTNPTSSKHREGELPEQMETRRERDASDYIPPSETHMGISSSRINQFQNRQIEEKLNETVETQ